MEKKIITSRANLKHTGNVMLGCSFDEGITWVYFSRNKYGSLQAARLAMEAHIREQTK